MVRKILIILILIIMLLGCDTTKLGEIQSRGKLIVGISDAFPPMSYLDETGNLVGHDVDALKLIAEEMGLELELKPNSFSGIFEDLESENIDFIMSSITITLERAEVMDFSNPYFNSGQAIVIREEEQNIAGPADLAGRKITIVKPGELQEQKVLTTNEIQSLKYTTQENLVYIEDLEMSTIISGESDAIFIDYPSAAYYSKINNKLKLAGPPFTQESYGIVFRKNERELVEELNKIIAKLKEEGKFEELENKWLK